ncbi:MAG: phenylalanine--tRNA ligase subunit beta [Gammaproteobacteria bacterium]
MKIPYQYIVQSIEENPCIEEISDRLFQLGHEHEIEDGIFDIEITPNRGDCLSLIGILRDLNVFYKSNRNDDIYSGTIEEFKLDFENCVPKFCPKISFLKLEINKEVHEYKGLLRDYFNDLHLTKNNFFTDVSNYLMYEIGQPTHCYDASKIKDKILLKEINHDLDFETLLGKTIKLRGKNNVFFINEEPINLAGIMGGKNSACSTDTTSIILECAYFEPEEIMGKSVKYDINSDAAHKFERGVDPLSHDKVIRRFIRIVQDHTEIKSIMLHTCDNYEHKPTNISLDHNKINRIIGTNISRNEYIDCLQSLGFKINDNSVTVPPYRNDVSVHNDLAEEIARIIGYDNIPIKKIKIPNAKQEIDSTEDKIRAFLVNNGFYEIINSPFVEHAHENSISIDNPLDTTRMFLRTDISKSLIENLLYNERRQKDSIKLFEVADIYSIEKNQVLVTKKISIIASGRVGKNYKDFSKTMNVKYMNDLFKEFLPDFNFNFKNISRELLNSKSKSEIVFCEIDFKELQSYNCNYKDKFLPPREFIKYKPISEFPSSVRDISYLIKDSTKINSLRDVIFNHKNPILRDVFIFDYYQNKKTDEIKMGFRFTFQSHDKTLTFDEIDNAIELIISETLDINSISIPGI